MSSPLPRGIPLLMVLMLIMGVGLPACGRPQATAGTISVALVADGKRQTLALPAGSTVQDAIDSAGLEAGALDRVEPPGYTVLTNGAEVNLTRITERFEIEEITIPFDRQTVRNEALPEGETHLLQPGVNGIQEITHRILEEEGIEVARTPVKNVVLQEPVPEIVMVGVQTAFTPLPIEGHLAYVSGRNAWLLQGDTGNRRPLVVSGDLDGRIFTLSPDGQWLLYSRQSDEGSDEINSLWVIATGDPEAEPIDLRARNVVHFADWLPDAASLTLAYSTVEPSPSPPGWQANNDLVYVTFTSAGVVLQPVTVIDTNAGGQYGWWGTTFAWGEDQRQLAYARADSIGVIDFEFDSFEPVYEFSPFQTFSDWAWVPGVAWGRDNRTLYFVQHGEPLALESSGASPVFNLLALTGPGGLELSLASRTGMFAYPSVSPPVEQPEGEIAYTVAFLQALSPLESQESTYRLTVMDRDGSNRRSLFPPEGEPGLEPRPVAWSPGADRIALIYRGDLWVVDVESGLGNRLTSDGQAEAYDWSP